MTHFDNYVSLYETAKESKYDFGCNEHIISYHYHSLQNYADTLRKLRRLSPSNLKYCRKTTLLYNNEDHSFVTSDVHIEIDFELIGVIEYGLFFEFFKHIKENMILNKTHMYVVCLHFEKITKDLSDVFFNFLDNSFIHFIFLTTQVSFLPRSILKKSVLKRFKTQDKSLYHETYKERVNKIISYIMTDSEESLFVWRESIYSLLVWNDSIHNAFSYLIFELIRCNYIDETQMNELFPKYYEIVHLYNNNYRSIYHLEHFIVYLRNLNKQTHHS